MKLDRNLMKLGDYYRGEEAFLICGPSEFDLVSLRREITFGVDDTFLYPYLDNLNFLVMFDLRYLKASPNMLPNIRVEDGILTSKFVYDNIFKHPKQYFYVGNGPQVFHKTMITRIWDGDSSAFLGMQLAYFLGIRKLSCIGLDNKYKKLFKLAKDAYEEDERILISI